MRSPVYGFVQANFMLSIEKTFLFFYSITHVVHIRMVNFALRYPLIYKFSKLRKTEIAALRILHGFAYDVIRKRRQELTEKSNNNDEDAADDVGIRKKRALLDILLQSSIDGKPLTDLDIREEVDVFMFGVIECSP